ncbi:translation initiation factor IF-2, partial [Limosilactobacillus reuteri]
SVSSIRKNEKKPEENNTPKKSNRRRNNKRRSSDRARDNKERDAKSNTGRPKAAALLQQFKQKQRAEEGQLNREAQKAKKEYHEHLKHPKKEQSEKDNKKTVKESNNKKVEQQVEKKVIGPKILKPSPARLKKNQPADNKEKVTTPRVTIPEAPKEEKRGNGRGRNMGKP